MSWHVQLHHSGKQRMAMCRTQKSGLPFFLTELQVVAERCRSAQVEEDVVSRLRRPEPNKTLTCPSPLSPLSGAGLRMLSAATPVRRRD